MDVTSFLCDVTNFVTNFVTEFVTLIYTSLGITFCSEMFLLSIVSAPMTLGCSETCSEGQIIKIDQFLTGFGAASVDIDLTGTEKIGI